MTSGLDLGQHLLVILNPDLTSSLPSRTKQELVRQSNCAVVRCVEGSVLPIVTWHDALHELIEQRHRERRVAVTRTPDHALDNQLTAGRTE